MNSRLKTCPFCGGSTQFIYDPEDCAEIRGIYCRGCKAVVKWNIQAKPSDNFGQTAEEWAEKWNRRANGNDVRN